MGLAPQIVEEVFEIVENLNHEGKSHLPDGRVKHQHGPQVRRLWLHHGIRPRGDRRCRHWTCANNEDVKEFYLGVVAENNSFKDVKSYKRRKRWLA